MLVSLRSVVVAPPRGPPPRLSPLSGAASPLAPRRSCGLMAAALPSVGRNRAGALRPPLRYGRNIDRRPQGSPSARPLAPTAPLPLRARLGGLPLPRTRQPPVGPSPAPDCFLFFASGLRPACVRAQSAHPLVKDI